MMLGRYVITAVYMLWLNAVWTVWCQIDFNRPVVEVVHTLRRLEKTLESIQARYIPPKCHSMAKSSILVKEMMTVTTQSSVSLKPECMCPECIVNVTKAAKFKFPKDVPENFTKIAQCAGKTFYRSKYETTFSLAYKACCEYGFELLKLDIRKKRTCLPMSPDFNERCWTAGKNIGCKGKWLWCGRNKLTSFDGLSSTWAVKEPSVENNEPCVTTSLFTYNLYDRMCDEKYKFICEY